MGVVTGLTCRRHTCLGCRFPLPLAEMTDPYTVAGKRK